MFGAFGVAPGAIGSQPSLGQGILLLNKAFGLGCSPPHSSATGFWAAAAGAVRDELWSRSRPRRLCSIFGGSSDGGMIALPGAWAIGARVEKLGADGKPRPIPGHNIPMVMLGTFILAFGWFGFNPGSTPHEVVFWPRKSP